MLARLLGKWDYSYLFLKLCADSQACEFCRACFHQLHTCCLMLTCEKAFDPALQRVKQSKELDDDELNK